MLDALKNGDSLEKVWIDKTITGPLEKEIRQSSRASSIPLQYVPKEKLNSLTKSKNHQGVVALLAQTEYLSIEQVLPHIFESGNAPLILALDGIEDVRNVGALARTALWFGVDAIVISIKKTAQLNSFAMKASAGALKDITICRENNLNKAIRYMQQSGLQICIADTEISPSHNNNPKYNEPMVLVMGSEYKGVSSEVKKIADAAISIPGTKKVESLNVSVAGGIILHEIYNQRNKEK